MRTREPSLINAESKGVGKIPLSGILLTPFDPMPSRRLRRHPSAEFDVWIGSLVILPQILLEKPDLSYSNQSK